MAVASISTVVASIATLLLLTPLLEGPLLAELSLLAVVALVALVGVVELTVLVVDLFRTIEALIS